MGMANALINFATSGMHRVMAAPSTGSIKINGAFLRSAGAVTAELFVGPNQGSATVSVVGPQSEITSSGFVLPVTELGWYDVPAGHEVWINLSDNIQVSGTLRWSRNG